MSLGWLADGNKWSVLGESASATECIDARREKKLFRKL